MRSVRRTVAVASALAVALGTAFTSVSSAETTGGKADPRPLLSLRTASDKIIVEKYGRSVYPNLGIYLEAGDEAFEVRLNRAYDYLTPIEGHFVTSGGDVALPADLLKSFRGLPRFTHLTITDKSGSVVVDRNQRFCSSGEPTRIRPDAPDVSTYPLDCPYNPFTLGAVFGIDPGFAMPAVEPYGKPLRIPLGRYTVTLAVNPLYRDLLGLSEEETTATVKMQVVKGDDCFGHGAGRGCKGAGSDQGSTSVAPRHPARHAPKDEPNLAPDPAFLPDLRSLPAYAIQIGKNGYMQFAATVWNAGPSPLVVDGFRRPTEDVMDAYQYFYDTDGTPQGYAPAGSMEWDPRHGHTHWHFRDFARYRLLDADMNNVVRSRKEAFCLANTDAVDYTVEGANWRPYNTDLHTSCGDYQSISVREVLDSGSGDTYYQGLPGQSFNVKDLEPGVYYIAVEANPAGNMFEVDTANNNAYRKIKLGGEPGGPRTVKVFPVGMVDIN